MRQFMEKAGEGKTGIQVIADKSENHIFTLPDQTL